MTQRATAAPRVARIFMTRGDLCIADCGNGAVGEAIDALLAGPDPAARR